MKWFKLYLSFSLVLFFTRCQKDNFSGSDGADDLNGKIVAEYIDILRDMTKQSAGFSPPVASRALGYIGLTYYESVVGGLSGYQSLAGVLNELTELPKPSGSIHWGQAGNAAITRALELYYPSIPEKLKPGIHYTLAKNKTNFLNQSNQSIIDKSTSFGIAIADAIFEYSKKDGGHEGYKNNFPAFQLPVGPGFWVPTGPNPTPLQPFWGNNRTFVKDDALHSQPVKHPEYSIDKNSQFYKSALEVYTVTKSLTKEQETIAKFWSDDAGPLGGTPPGHSLGILSQLIRDENIDFTSSTEAFAKLSLGVADAFISCWRCKYVFNLMRPVTYLNQNIDPGWKPILVTPPFPEYTSGHSVQSGASARILTKLFGDNHAFVDRVHSKRTDINGSPRSFNSFDHFAQEAAISRLYGGIHFIEAINLGVSQGNKIGDAVNALPFKK